MPDRNRVVSEAAKDNGAHVVPENADAVEKRGLSLQRLRENQDFDAMLAVRKPLVTLRVDKPVKTWFFRVHSDPGFRIIVALLENRDDRVTYLVDPDLIPYLGEYEETGILRRVELVTAINRQGVPFLWPLRFPSGRGKDSWADSAREAARLAEKQWCRLAANMSAQAYDVFVAESSIPDPTWPEQSFEDLLKLGFKDAYIEELDHPALLELRGA